MLASATHDAFAAPRGAIAATVEAELLYVFVRSDLTLQLSDEYDPQLQIPGHYFEYGSFGRALPSGNSFDDPGFMIARSGPSASEPVNLIFKAYDYSTFPVSEIPIEGLSVEIQCTGGGVSDQQGPFITDDQGWPGYIFCPTGTTHIHIGASYDNDDIRTWNKWGSYGAVQESGIPIANVNPMDVFTGSDHAAWTLMHSYYAAYWAVNEFGYSRQKLNVHLQDTLAANSYVGGSIDKVYIYQPVTFSGGGLYILTHEYGHAYHEKALGGLFGPNALVQGGCSGSHAPSIQTGLACAWVEGFAEFFAAWSLNRLATVDTTLDVGDSQIEKNPYRTYGDGSVYEGAVAGFLYDLMDGSVEWDNATNNGKVSETHDTITYSAATLGLIMNTCQTRVGTTWYYPAVGVDQFIYCAEQSLSAHPVTAARSVSFSAFSVNSHSWSQSAIRSLWLKNLYDQ